MYIADMIMYAVAYFGLFTSIFFLLTLVENRKQLRNPKLTGYLPKVTIIVPACNEENTISKTINSLLTMNYPKNKREIIIVNDGSVDKTYKVAKTFEKFGVKVLTKKNGGKGTALNLGLKYTTGEFVGCLDADSIVAPDALKKMLYYFKNKKVMAVTPSLKCTKPKTFWQRIQVIEFLLGVYLRKVFAFLGSIHVTPGPFTIFRKKFFDKYGGYDTSTVTEDIEISLRIQSKKYEIENAVDANVYAIPKPTFLTLFKQRLRWYRGFLDNIIKYKGLFSRKHGNLGMFILPTAFLSVGLAIYASFYAGYVLLNTNIQKIINLYYVNFDIAKLLKINLDSFYLNQSGLMFIGLLSLAFGLLVIYLAKIISNEKQKIKYCFVLFTLFYLPFFALWWIAAAYFKITKGNVVWRGRQRSATENKYHSFD